MITWRPDNVDTVNSWKLAMVISKGYERILIGSNYEIKQMLSGKKNVSLFHDEVRQLGTFLIGFDDDRTAGKWRTALRYLEEAQEISISQKILHLMDKESPMVKLEEKAQEILQEKYDTGDPICKYVAIRIWYGYWRIRENRNKERNDIYFTCMENLLRPFYRGEVILSEDRKILPEDPLFRWPTVIEDCDERMTIYNQRLKGADRYIVVDDSLIPLKQYYTDSLATWKLCIIQCKMCGKHFIARSLHSRYCGESCIKAARIMRREKRMQYKPSKDVEQLCRNEYAYWYSRCRKAKASTAWTETDLYDLESAFIKFKEQKVLMRKKYRRGETSFQELISWFLVQRNVVDTIMDKY